MTPLRIVSTSQVEQGFRLGPELKLHDVQVAGVDFERKVTSERTKVFLQAQRELRSDPGWEFTRTGAMELLGSYRLIMVVRAAKGGPISLNCTVRAATKGNLMRWYKQELPNPLTLAATL